MFFLILAIIAEAIDLQTKWLKQISFLDYWVKKIEGYSERQDEEEKYGTDESKRPGNRRQVKTCLTLKDLSDNSRWIS